MSPSSKADTTTMNSKDESKRPLTSRVAPLDGLVSQKSSESSEESIPPVATMPGTASATSSQASTTENPVQSNHHHPYMQPQAFASRPPSRIGPPHAAVGHSFLDLAFPMPPPFPMMRYMSSAGFSDISLPLPYLSYSQSFGANGLFGPFGQATNDQQRQHPPASFKTPTYHSRTGSSSSTSVASSDLDIAAKALLELTPSVHQQVGATSRNPTPTEMEPLIQQQEGLATKQSLVTPSIQQTHQRNLAAIKQPRQVLSPADPINASKKPVARPLVCPKHFVPHPLDRDAHKKYAAKPCETVTPFVENHRSQLDNRLEVNQDEHHVPVKKPFHLHQSNYLPLPSKRKTSATDEVNKRPKPFDPSTAAAQKTPQQSHLPDDLFFLLQNNKSVAKQAMQLIEDSKETDVPCKCKNTKCLKLYCSCFQAGALCNSSICRCNGCENTAECSVPGGSRTKVILDTLKRRPDAFEKRLRKKTGQGCFCKKTRCLRKYCDCFANKTYCGSICGCTDCENVLPNDRHPLRSLASAYGVGSPRVGEKPPVEPQPTI